MIGRRILAGVYGLYDGREYDSHQSIIHVENAKDLVLETALDIAKKVPSQ